MFVYSNLRHVYYFLAYFWLGKMDSMQFSQYSTSTVTDPRILLPGNPAFASV